MKKSLFFRWLAALCGWVLVPVCHPRECVQYGCDFPYCHKWEFRPEETA